MMRSFLLLVTLVLSCSSFVRTENFIVPKQNPQKQSGAKLKEQYGQELADLVRIIPELQKKLADIQEQLIDELYILLDNNMHLSKSELDAQVCKAQELACYLENDLSCVSKKSAFLKKPAQEKTK